jgi:hypothetical protein
MIALEQAWEVQGLADPALLTAWPLRVTKYERQNTLRAADLRGREALGVHRERRAGQHVLRGAVLLGHACQDGCSG